MKYKKKPIVIEAIQLTDFNAETMLSVLEFMGQIVDTNSATTNEKFYDYCEQRGNVGYLTIETLEGNMKANLGDYIIKGVNGEFYPCKPDIFEKTYEKVE